MVGCVVIGVVVNYTVNTMGWVMGVVLKLKQSSLEWCVNFVVNVHFGVLFSLLVEGTEVVTTNERLELGV